MILQIRPWHICSSENLAISKYLYCSTLCSNRAGKCHYIINLGCFVYIQCNASQTSLTPVLILKVKLGWEGSCKGWINRDRISISNTNIITIVLKSGIEIEIASFINIPFNIKYDKGWYDRNSMSRSPLNELCLHCFHQTV